MRVLQGVHGEVSAVSGCVPWGVTAVLEATAAQARHVQRHTCALSDKFLTNLGEEALRWRKEIGNKKQVSVRFFPF